MKHYYKLTCFFFRYLKWITLGMILLAAAAELGWLWYSAQQPEAAYATYQLMVYNPGRWFHVSKIFSIVFTLFCVAISLWILASFHGKGQRRTRARQGEQGIERMALAMKTSQDP